MSTAILLALVLGYACIEPSVGFVSSLHQASPLDTARPLVRFSPTRGTNDSLYANDGFGYSAAIHHTVQDLSSLTIEEVLEQVRIIVGSPRGRFPGGFDDMFADELADVAVCDAAEFFYNATVLQTFPKYPGQIPSDNRECFGVSGLVYLCRASVTNCEPFLGNQDKNDEDGYLYKRNPNVQLTEAYFEYSNEGLMGATMFSTGDYFVACAPRFSYRRQAFQTPNVYEPRGRCVFSDRSLQDFKFLDPCEVNGVQVGSQTNQADTGFCQAGSSVYVSETNNIILGVPGYSNSRGRFGYYDDLTATGGTNSNSDLPYGIPQVTQATDVYSAESFTYFGSSVVAGNINGSERVLTSSLRYSPAQSSPGSVNIITSFGDPNANNEELSNTVINILGEQLGESFGKVLVAADLNGDGTDELVVTAPTHSVSQSRNPELGRVYIMRSVFNQQSGELEGFDIVQMLTGRERLGRFGYAATNLGDINDDGLEDIAISAPYEGSGVVYIFYGNSSGSYINTTPRQIIRGEDMVERVSELESLSTFGAFLQGNTDIDNNEYQDLLIGAEESQAVFVVRTRPTAQVNLTITTNVSSIFPTAADCVLDSVAYPCFNLTVCGTYTGRGLTSFDAVYNIVEVKAASGESRLLFENDSPTLSFTGAGIEACSSITTYVTVAVSGILDDLVMTAEMRQFDLPTAQVDSTLQFTSLATEPVIESDPVQALVEIVLDCGDNVCESDVGISLIRVNYLNSSSQLHSNQNQLTVGAISRMSMELSYFNLAEQALNFLMYLSLPKGFTPLTPVPSFITCIENDDVQMDDNNTLYRCTEFRVPLVQDETRNIILQWTVSDSLVGNEGSLPVFVSIAVVNRTENIEPVDVLENNMIEYNISVVARAVYSLAVTYPPTPPTYVTSEIQPEVDQSSQLGSRLPITVTFTNSGPSPLPQVNLIILLPLQNALETGELYYLYPLVVNDNDTGIACSVSDVRRIVNPSGLALDGRRRKRQGLRDNAPGVINRILRTVRQTPRETTLDCTTTPSLCSMLRCNATNVGPEQTRTVVITTRIDNRFFYDKEADYVLTAEVRVEDDPNSFIDTSGSTQTNDAALTLSMQPIIPMSSGVPDWVIAICIIAGIVFVVLVALVLALLIFLHIRRRKRRGEAEIHEDEVETYNEKAFDNDAADL